MRPQQGEDTLELPLTFDVSSSTVPLTEKRIFGGMLILVGIILAGILLAIVLKSFGGILFSAFLVIASSTLFRLLYFKERYYKKKFAELETRGYIYKTNVIWDIYEIAPNFPVCSFKNGSKAVFVSFDKDIIVGKPDNNDFLHYEAISDAYNRIAQKNIECIHIDYMDTVGKDGRIDKVVKNLIRTPNAELGQLLSLVFEYQQYTMSRSYATYDVFAFYYRYNDEEFQDDLEAIIGSFMQANYIRHRFAGTAQLRELVKSVYNLPDFSVNEACDNVFKSNSTNTFIRVIYTELDGVKTILNKTKEEKEQERTQNDNRRTRPMPAKKKEREVPTAEIDIFADYEPEETQETSNSDFAYMQDKDILSGFGVNEEIDIFGDD